MRIVIPRSALAEARAQGYQIYRGTKVFRANEYPEGNYSIRSKMTAGRVSRLAELHGKRAALDAEIENLKAELKSDAEHIFKGPGCNNLTTCSFFAPYGEELGVGPRVSRVSKVTPVENISLRTLLRALPEEFTKKITYTPSPLLTRAAKLLDNGFSSEDLTAIFDEEGIHGELREQLIECDQSKVIPLVYERCSGTALRRLQAAERICSAKNMLELREIYDKLNLPFSEKTHMIIRYAFAVTQQIKLLDV